MALSRVFLLESECPIEQRLLEALPDNATIAILGKEDAAKINHALATVDRTWVETRTPCVASSLPGPCEWKACEGRLRDQPLVVAAESCEVLKLRGEPLPRTWEPMQRNPREELVHATKRRRRTPSPSPPPDPSSSESEGDDTEADSDSDDEDDGSDSTVARKTLAMLCAAAMGMHDRDAWESLAKELTEDKALPIHRIRMLVAAALISTSSTK
jgi:hypothetical protein